MSSVWDQTNIYHNHLQGVEMTDLLDVVSPTWQRAMVLDASYSPKTGDIELFVRKEDGGSAVLLVQGMKPYFYVSAPINMAAYLKSRLLADPGVQEVTETTLKVGQVDTPCLKVTINYAFDTPKYRNDLEKLGVQVFAADIVYHLRYLIDRDLGLFIQFTGTRASPSEWYKADEVWHVYEVKNAEPFETRLKTLAFDIENRLGSDEIYCISAYSPGAPPITFKGPDAWYFFTDFVLKLDPDLLIGHNVVDYDIPLLDRNAGADGWQVGRKWGRPQSRPKNAVHIPGRIVADSLVWARRLKDKGFERHSLEYLAPKILGPNRLKGAIKYTELDQKWATSPQEVISYCENDAVLAYDIYEKIGHLKRAVALATVAKLPLKEVFYYKNNVLLDRLGIPQFDTAGVVVPCNKRRKGEDEEGYVEKEEDKSTHVCTVECPTKHVIGAYVHEPDPGLYPCVAVLDITAMYPSQIVANNICPTTLVDETFVGPRHAVEISLKDGTKTGRVVYFRADTPGIIPGLLTYLKTERNMAKGQLTDAKGAQDTSLVEYWDAYQDGVKTVMNAFYGLLASGFYRFTNLDIGNAITSSSRTKTLSMISDLSGKGYKVVLSDTDSVGVVLPDVTDSSIAVAVGRTLADNYSTPDIQVAFDKLLMPFFTGAKKRYFGYRVWPEPVVRYERGYEVRRSDKFPMMTATQSLVMDHIIQGDFTRAAQVTTNAIDIIAMGKALPEQLVISKTFYDDTHYDEPNSEVVVKVGRLMRAAKLPTIPGTKVSWIVADHAPLVPIPFDTYKGEAYDRFYYVEKLGDAIGRILGPLGWDADKLAGPTLAALKAADKARKKRAKLGVGKSLEEW